MEGSSDRSKLILPDRKVDNDLKSKPPVVLPADIWNDLPIPSKPYDFVKALQEGFAESNGKSQHSNIYQQNLLIKKIGMSCKLMDYVAADI